MEILVCTFRKTVGCTFMEIDISALLDLAATGCRGYADGIRWWIARRNTRYTRCCWCCNLSGIQSWYWQQLWTIGQGHKKSLIRGWLLPNRFNTKTPQSPHDPTSTGHFGSELLKASSADLSSYVNIFNPCQQRKYFQCKYFQPLSARFSHLMHSNLWADLLSTRECTENIVFPERGGLKSTTQSWKYDTLNDLMMTLRE